MNPPCSAEEPRLSPVFGLVAVALALAIAAGFGGNRIAVWAPAAAASVGALAWLSMSRPVRPPPAAAALWIAVMAWGAAQAAFLSPAPDESWRAVARLGFYGALFALAYGARPGGAAMRGLALWCAALSAYGIWAWAAGVNPILGAVEAYPDPLESSFVNRSAFALYAGFGAIAALGAFAARTRGTYRGALRRVTRRGWVWIGAALICIAAAALSGSRGGMAATGIGLLAFAAALNPRLIIPAAAVGVVLAASPYLAAPERLDLLSDERGPIYQAIATGAYEEMWRGRGIGAFRDTFRPFASEAWRWGDWDHAHNAYLEAVFELGVPAAIAKMLAVALLALACLRRARRGGAPAARAAVAFGACVAAGAHGLVDLSMSIPATPAALALLLGAALAPSRRSSLEKDAGGAFKAGARAEGAEAPRGHVPQVAPETCAESRSEEERRRQ